MTVTLSHYIDSTNPSIRFEKVSDPDTDLFVWATVGYPKNYATKVSNPDTDLFVWATVGYPNIRSENDREVGFDLFVWPRLLPGSRLAQSSTEVRT